MQVIRKKDDAVLNLQWSTFFNPANQKILGAVASMSETAHPFRIEANNVVCAFTEFADFYRFSEKAIQPSIDSLVADLNKMDLNGKNYAAALEEYGSIESYKTARDAINKELFWVEGEYEIKIVAEYGNSNKEFCYNFAVSKENCTDLLYNIDEVLALYLKNIYRVPGGIKTVQVELTGKY